jgi:hypothetical protein
MKSIFYFVIAILIFCSCSNEPTLKKLITKENLKNDLELIIKENPELKENITLKLLKIHSSEKDFLTNIKPFKEMNNISNSEWKDIYSALEKNYAASQFSDVYESTTKAIFDSFLRDSITYEFLIQENDSIRKQVETDFELEAKPIYTKFWNELTSYQKKVDALYDNYNKKVKKHNDMIQLSVRDIPMADNGKYYIAMNIKNLTKKSVIVSSIDIKFSNGNEVLYEVENYTYFGNYYWGVNNKILANQTKEFYPNLKVKDISEDKLSKLLDAFNNNKLQASYNVPCMFIAGKRKEIERPRVNDAEFKRKNEVESLHTFWSFSYGNSWYKNEYPGYYSIISRYAPTLEKLHNKKDKIEEHELRHIYALGRAIGNYMELES